ISCCSKRAMSWRRSECGRHGSRSYAVDASSPAHRRRPPRSICRDARPQPAIGSGVKMSAKGRPERELVPLGGKARSAKGAPTGLSVILIAKDEEACIARALQSVAWVDEIVVVDSGSTDRTVDIAREL